MANYANIKNTINQNIKTNGNQQITGQVLQNVLNAIVDNLTAGYLMVGIATEDGNPGTPDQNLCWLATQGTYTNYGNITVESGKLAVIKYNGTWTSDTVDVQGAVSAGDGINISETGAVSVKTGTGVKIDEEGNVAADLVAGDYISIEGNKINCTLDTNPFYFVDALPDSPVPGTENQVYVVPASDSPAVNLYKWNSETSQFDLVGTIDLGIDTSNFIKKGKNDITEPLELDSFVESTKPETEQEVLTIKASDSPSVIFKTLTEDTEEGGVDYIVVKAMLSKGSLTNQRYIGLGIVKKDGSYVLLNFNKEGFLSLRGTGDELIFRPTFYIVCPSGQSWDNPNSTFSISGIYSKLKTALALNASVVLTFSSRDVNIVTDLQWYPTDGDIQLTYRDSGRRFSLTIKSDDSITITSAAYIWRFNATDYGITYWYNASGTNQTLYSDLRRLINGTSDIGGILGYLCDIKNIYVITNLNIYGTGIQVLFLDGNTNKHLQLTINPDGQYNVIDVSSVKILYSDDYNISSMPIPVEWPIASGTDVNLYNDIKKAYDTGAQLILIEGSAANKGINEYAVSEIRNVGNGRYDVYFSLQGYKYCLAVNSDGVIATASNLIQTELSSLSLTQNIAATYAQKIWQRVAIAVSSFLNGDLYLADTKGKICRVIAVSLPSGAGAQAYTMLYTGYFNQGADPATAVLRSMNVQYANSVYSGEITKAEFVDGI